MAVVPAREIVSQVRSIGELPDRAAVAAQFAATPGGFLLESIADHPTYGCYGIYGVALDGGVEDDVSGDPFDAIARGLRLPAAFRESPPVPFVGGLVGWLGYECGRFIEPFPRRHEEMIGVPAARWSACDTVLIHDRAADRWLAAGCDFLDASFDRPPLSARLDALCHWAGDASARHAPPPPVIGWLKSNMSEAAYRAAVERALAYIRAGDTFQVNLAQRFTAPFSGDPWLLYERLCQRNPAMFAAYLPWDRDAHDMPHSAILSSSPELFLDLRGRRVVTRPIKGTRRRTGDASHDAAARNELETSAKDAAELVMIVDLERNDLGRVCEYGSVRVTCAAETEEHPTVLHRVATVEGVLREDCNAVDLLRATFPGGSITGAPKVRAMQIIDALEPHPRGPYCGAIGWIGADGSMMLNLAIRTMLVSRGAVHLWAGGGIVADSDPEAEYAETLDKAKGMRRALAGES